MSPNHSTEAETAGNPPADGQSSGRLYAVSTLWKTPEPSASLAENVTPIQPGQQEQPGDSETGDVDACLAWLDDESAPGFAAPIANPIRAHLRHGKQAFAVNAAGEELYRWATEANALLVSPDHRVLDPNGRLLLDREANGPDAEAVIPFPVESRQRKASVAVQLNNRLIDPVDGVLPIRSSLEVEVRSPANVARRAIATFLIATRAESILSGRVIDADRMRERCPIGYEAMTPRERAFFDAEVSPATQGGLAQTASELVWRYEALATLQWALDMQFELTWPDERADLTSTTRLMIDLPDEAIVEQARLRGTAELLDAAELHYQSLHAIIASEQTGKDLSKVLDPGVVCERLIALGWVCGLIGETPAEATDDWDATSEWVERGCPI
ncbi:DUF4272 domain-containing protein [Rhodopirellula sallentina]|uniref:Uncharacterized protein n=1 Tax=Rhodopirellula sallentina SM41 TaxID=1263870 RepID=M5U9H0_9BACT|nr:DUF4272 domain-containing protein [Rhodopirellula sallentina]EMI54501.1 hypothetical protein RSSM_04096 [Rhodopirellula sallentina SM41]